MSIQAGKETVFGSAFQESVELSDQPAWLKEIRDDAYAYFEQFGFPTTRNEDWKYTDVRQIQSEQLPWIRNGKEQLAGAGEREAVKNALSTVSSENLVVFVDGVLDDGLSRMPKVPEGAVVAGFGDSLENETFRANIAKVVDPGFNGFAALNTAFIERGLFIHVPEDVRIEETIHVVFIATSEASVFPRILYVGEKGSEAEIVEVFMRTDEAVYMTDAVGEIVLNPNARLTHTRVQRESHNAYHVGVTMARLSRDSVYDNTNINLGGRISRHDANLEFTGENGEAWVDGLYLVEDGQHTDTHSQIDHRVKNCVSHQTYKGILDGKSHAVFNGKVFVHVDASGTDAEQSNKNLLLSNDAQVDTKPQLEIFNDDVKCAHGATVGQLEEESLFYLLSRGLDRDLARNLLTYGFAEEIINKISAPMIKKQLDEAVLNRLHARL